eukprot:6177544-Pleurochrysis_carterae.AAC.2
MGPCRRLFPMPCAASGVGICTASGSTSSSATSVSQSALLRCTLNSQAGHCQRNEGDCRPCLLHPPLARVVFSPRAIWLVVGANGHLGNRVAGMCNMTYDAVAR